MNMKIISTLLLVGIAPHVFAQNLHQKIENIASATTGKVGVAMLNIETHEKMMLNENEPIPMQSVFKFPLAMAVLNQVDAGKLSLNQKIFVTKKELRTDTWSPLQKKYPDGNTEISIAELIQYTVSESDNNGCDILFKLMGGPKRVQNYIRKLGIKDMNIVGNEEDMQNDWNVQYANFSTPLAMLQLLEKFNKKGTLSSSSQDFLMKAMTDSPTGAKRLKYLLPKGTVIAHKTGTGGRNKVGLIGAINDAGIITLPNGQHLAIVVFVSNATEPDDRVENIIAQISKEAYQHFSVK